MSSFVLDASALLALLNSEAGAQQVEETIVTGAAMSAVNISEVIAKLADLGLSERDIRETIDAIPVEIVPFSCEHAYYAGVLRIGTRKNGLSLGDRACLALGRDLGLPILTTDRAWNHLGPMFDVRFIR